MSATDPAAIAREVLDLTHEDETVTVCSVPDNKVATLANTVIDLTAKVERVEALADRLEREADELNGHPSRLAAHTGSVKKRTVARIRTALNGENHD